MLLIGLRNLTKMKKVWRYLFPGLFGLLVYGTIRLINDTLASEFFWERSWKLNALEIGDSVLTGYLLVFAFNRLFRRFDRKLQQTIDYRIVLYELFWVFVLTELIVNMVLTPLVALTDDGLSWGDFAIINTIPLLYCLLYYAVVRSHKLLKAYVNNKIQLEKITNDHLETELKFLKAQYHPHFLFNALNTVYFQMDEDVSGAKRSIEKFSELLRYQLYDQQQTVPVSRELDYLQHFIELQRIRTSEKPQLKVQFDPQLNGQQIYPLLLLPLVENAFKYVGGDFRVSIHAYLQENRMLLRVENSIPPHAPVTKGSGIGLENLRRRLALLYPGQSSLETKVQQSQYTEEGHDQPTIVKEDQFVALLTINLKH